MTRDRSIYFRATSSPVFHDPLPPPLLAADPEVVQAGSIQITKFWAAAEARPDAATDGRDHRRAHSPPGRKEGDCIVGAYNRSAIGTLVERTFRYTILLHLDGESRTSAVRDQLIATFGALPPSLRKSLTWDQGSEMSHHHTVAEAVQMPVFFCDPGSRWQRPSNENTNGLLRNYFPKGTNLRVHGAEELQRVSDELNRRPRKTLDWKTPHELFATFRP